MLPFFLIYFHFAGHMHKNVLLLTKTIKTLVCAACSVSIRLWESVKLCLCKHNHFLPDTHRQPTALQQKQAKPRKHELKTQLSEVPLMKTKTIKTPSVGLTLLLSICDKCYDTVFKSTLLRQSHTTRHNHCRGSIPQKEKQ